MKEMNEWKLEMSEILPAVEKNDGPIQLLGHLKDIKIIPPSFTKNLTLTGYSKFASILTPRTRKPCICGSFMIIR